MSRMKPSRSIPLNQPYLPVIGSEGFIGEVDVVDDLEEEMEPFDMDSFVDRLVESDPPHPAKAAIIWDAPVAADTPPEVVTNSGNSHRLFLQPNHSQSWPEQRPAASAQGAEWRRANDEPSMVVPDDTFRDVSSPEVLPAVEPGFVRTVSIVDNNVLDNSAGGMNSYSGGADDKLHAARKDIVAMELRVLAALSYRLTVSYCICFVYFFWYLRWAWISLFIYLVDEPKISLYRRETDRDLRSACRCVADFTVLNFSERAEEFGLARRVQPSRPASACSSPYSG